MDPPVAPAKPSADNHKVKAYFYSMVGHAEKCIEKYCELAGITEQQLKVVATPGLDGHQIPSEKFETKGILHANCSRIVLKIL